MSLHDEMTRAGHLLFRWRSYLPLLLFPMFVVTLRNFTYLENSEALDDLWEVVCLGIAGVGFLLRVLTVGFVPANTSGRATREPTAATLNTTGLYSVVRHPLYLGNGLIWLGVASFAHIWWLVLLVLLVFGLYYERIMLAQEEFLRTRFGAEFDEWAQRTPAFIPNLRQWHPPTLPFSWRTVLARENATLFAIITTFFALEVTGDFFLGKLPHVDRDWLILFIGGLVTYLGLRWMKKHRWLVVDGR